MTPRRIGDHLAAVVTLGCLALDLVEVEDSLQSFCRKEGRDIVP